MKMQRNRSAYIEKQFLYPLSTCLRCESKQFHEFCTKIPAVEVDQCWRSNKIRPMSSIINTYSLCIHAFLRLKSSGTDFHCFVHDASRTKKKSSDKADLKSYLHYQYNRWSVIPQKAWLWSDWNVLGMFTQIFFKISKLWSPKAQSANGER